MCVNMMNWLRIFNNWRIVNAALNLRVSYAIELVRYFYFPLHAYTLYVLDFEIAFQMCYNLSWVH